MCSTTVDKDRASRHSQWALAALVMLRPDSKRWLPKRLGRILLAVAGCAACNAPIAGGQTGDGSGVIDEPGPDDRQGKDTARIAH